jgi:putative flippase GtrA
LKSSSSPAQFARFVAIGATNALATWLVYLALLRWTGYAVAYSVSYVLGIAFAYVANSTLVFRSRMSVRTAAAFPLVYVFQYLAGLALVALQIELLGVPAWLAPWIATAVLVPASFVLTRFVLQRKNPDAPRHHQ